MRSLVLVGLVLFAVVVACGGDDEGDGNAGTGTSTATGTPLSTEPVGIIAIGHSGLTGEASVTIGREAKTNSWATGTNPEVNSIYSRMIVAFPETDGHVTNAARGSASVATLRGQAESALNTVPEPRLVIIQAIDADIQCDGTDAEHVVDFGIALEDVLRVITEASPDSKILIVSQAGRPSAALVEELVATDPTVKESLTGTGICDFYNPAGDLVSENFATLTSIIESYEAEQVRVCSAVPQCVDDGGVLADLDIRLSDYVEGDWNHYNIQGLARIAETTWPIAANLLEVPE